MKKNLIALAISGAVALPAMAQNVTLYGQIDAGVAHFNGVGTVKTTQHAITDGSVSSPLWGLRGTEDLGGGMKTVFQLESDIQTNNGGYGNSGLFRRAAFAGLTGGFGEVTVGLRLNPLIATFGALMPVAGNSVSTLTSAALSFNNFYTKNAITYTTPNVNGLVGQFQYGAANSFSTTTTGGVVEAASLTYTSGNLALRGAYQNRTSNGTTSGANTTNAAFGTVPTIDQAARSAVAGAMYSIGDWSLALAMFENNEQPSAGATKVKRGGNQLGIGYKMSPAVLLGGSLTRAEGSELLNAQARYSLSKRTTAYAQFGASSNNTNTVASKQVSFQPYALNTGNHPAVAINDYAGVVGRKSNAMGVGIIHTF
jgi:GBP family porin